MADAIKDRHKIESELIAGGNGVFDVEIDGDLVYSRHKTGLFPEAEEILAAIAARQ